MPEMSIDTSMFSTEVVVSAEQLSHVFKKQLATGTPTHESKKFAGKEVRLVHWFQALVKLVPADVSINGNEVRL